MTRYDEQFKDDGYTRDYRNLQLLTLSGRAVKPRILDELAKLNKMKFKPLPEGEHIHSGPEGSCYMVNGRLRWYDDEFNIIDPPDEIDGNFNFKSMDVVSLEGCPRIVNGNFNCSYTHISSLKGAPVQILSKKRRLRRPRSIYNT